MVIEMTLKLESDYVIHNIGIENYKLDDDVRHPHVFQLLPTIPLSLGWISPKLVPSSEKKWLNLFVAT